MQDTNQHNTTINENIYIQNHDLRMTLAWQQHMHKQA